MSDKDTSSAQSYYDKTAGALQSALGYVTGSTADQQQGEAKKSKAAAENEASHATAKLGSLTASSSGAVTQDNPDRTEGSWNQTLGSGKEFIGGLVGSESLKQEGIKQNQAGKEQEARGQLTDLSEGVSDRVSGAVGGVVAGLTGDKKAEAAYQERHDKGKTQQRGVEYDLGKKADAEKQKAER